MDTTPSDVLQTEYIKTPKKTNMQRPSGPRRVRAGRTTANAKARALANKRKKHIFASK
jgi:hypothetical protein